MRLTTTQDFGYDKKMKYWPSIGYLKSSFRGRAIITVRVVVWRFWSILSIDFRRGEVEK